MAGYWPISTTIEFSRHSDRDSNIKMGCSIGLLKLKFIINEQRSIEFQFKSRSSSTSYVSKTLDWHLWPLLFVRQLPKLQPVYQIFHFLRLAIFSAFSLYCSWTEKSTMENEDNTSSYITACVLNAFLSYTAVMLNCLTIYALTKLSSLPRPLKTLLLSLAVSDLGVGLMVLPSRIASFVMIMEQKTENNPAYNITVKFFSFTFNLFGFASFFGVTLLSLDRFLAIYLHLR